MKHWGEKEGDDGVNPGLSLEAEESGAQISEGSGCLP